MAQYVFVGGLHRSGTSIAARMIASLHDVAAVTAAPVPENEGVYLQGAIAHTALHGQPMHFATDAEQHHIEGCRHDTLEVRERLTADWEPWFQPKDASWRVEKSPVNLCRMRLYQQLFPLSQFIVVLRHPQAVAGAVAKWVDMERDLAVDHWIAAHEIMQADTVHLHSAMILRYEDIMARPAAYMSAFAGFLQIDGAYDADLPLGDRNDEYDGWSMATNRARSIANWGYAEDMRLRNYTPIVRHPLRAVREAVAEALAGDTRES